MDSRVACILVSRELVWIQATHPSCPINTFNFTGVTRKPPRCITSIGMWLQCLYIKRMRSTYWMMGLGWDPMKSYNQRRLWRSYCVLVKSVRGVSLSYCGCSGYQRSDVGHRVAVHILSLQCDKKPGKSNLPPHERRERIIGHSGTFLH